MRYTGSKAKRCRAVGVNLYGNDKFDRLKKQYPPGQHGQVRKKRSDFAVQLLEKQKIKWTYGVTERQLVRLYEEAARAKDVTGTRLLQLLECRLDNVLFRSGLFNSRDQARQLIVHGHILVNQKRLSVPSARLKVGDVISFRERSNNFIRKLIREYRLPLPTWLTLDDQKLVLTFKAVPHRDQIDPTFKESMVIEYYSR